ncbi:PIN-like domain-containing protein [Pseudomonas viridiflava]|uniref:PIN-like domain-containing protein n=1 Tax=Pseudomonas viridiflava TaxID=33069 RepID=UPI0005B72365|nr:PIN domain-containing protein [Pseudomonas viridiflava]KIQ33774.1 hypothetical protein RT94_12610 [Pseudomonas viridiflava]
MRNSFNGYYPPTPEQYEHLWNEALFVLDTNVLLNLYRLPTVARDELLEVLRLLENRLWIPHQVGLEFQRGRLNVIANERKSTEDALSSAQNVVGQVKQKVEGLQIDKRGLGIESQPLLDQLERSNQELIQAIKAIHSAQIDVSSNDPVRSALDELLCNKVGDGPKTQEELDEITAKGEERFLDKIPPGFADADKDKNPNEATFIFDHIKYQRKFGDLILWKQLLSHVKESNIKTVLFITADRKDDWWWKEHGKTIGPHPELIREIQKSGGVELFWMYSSVQFVEQANKYSKAKISTESVAEIEQVTIQELPEENYPSDFINDREGALDHYKKHILHTNTNEKSRNSVIGDWLKSYYPLVLNSTRKPIEFIRLTPKGSHGYVITQSIKINTRAPHLYISPKVKRAIALVQQGELEFLSVVALITYDQYQEIADKQEYSVLLRRIRRTMARYDIESFFIGVLHQGTFQILIFEENISNPPSEE